MGPIDSFQDLEGWQRAHPDTENLVDNTEVVSRMLYRLIQSVKRRQ